MSKGKDYGNDPLNTTEDTASTSAATLSVTNTLDESQKRNIAYLSNSLSTTISSDNNHSKSWISNSNNRELVPSSSSREIKSDLLSSFYQLADMFVCGSLEEDVDHRQTVLKETTKTIDIIRVRAPEATQELVDTLFSMLTIQNKLLDVAAESAISIATFLEQGLTPKDRRYIVQKAEENSSNLISVLSTAYLTSVKSPNNKDAMESLFAIAAASKSIQRKMVKRRGTNLAVARCLRESDHWKRAGALDFCGRVFQDDASVESLISMGKGENLEILVDGLIKRVYDDTIVQDQLAAISILSRVISLDCHVEKALEAFHSVAFHSKSRDAVIVAADAFCSYVEKNGDPTVEHQRALIGFATLPQKEIRRLALVILQSHTNNTCSAELLNKMDTIDALLSIILHSPAQGDSIIALDIVRQMARSRVHHTNLCRHPQFLSTIVSMANSTECPNPLATEILIALALNKENKDAFLRAPDILQWLTNFATANPTDGNIQEQFVSVILFLTLGGT
eukprot:CAMPEP_0113637398 /NCGR_PEP_ID=MMETSP0017_2-20120614/19575_1 /TAXON_ID=2856 /ORGANISM="Cylindrotheca closterium" /LENGTH=508 /DNA_ID=CAMNT_0000548423 /DNA_START=417 /DNA_END=1943 /DNA_ORIENTATION=+ /assembly_acc=CAM_ASM_000147